MITNKANTMSLGLIKMLNNKIYMHVLVVFCVIRGSISGSILLIDNLMTTFAH